MGFIPNLAGLAEVRVAPFMVSAVLNVAEGIRDRAKDIANAEFMPPPDTGTYVASLNADANVQDGAATGHAHADAPYSLYIEFGTEDTPTYAPLRRAAESFKL